MKKLSIIIQDLVKVRGENKLEASDECLFDNAVKIFISNSIQESKFPSKEVKGPLGNETRDSGPTTPTEKQINFLKKNGIKINPNLTRAEATLMIKNFMNNLQKENI
jgi:hypothetical protein